MLVVESSLNPEHLFRFGHTGGQGIILTSRTESNSPVALGVSGLSIGTLRTDDRSAAPLTLHLAGKSLFRNSLSSSTALNTFSQSMVASNCFLKSGSSPLAA